MQMPCLLLDFGNTCVKARVDQNTGPGILRQICYDDLTNEPGDAPALALKKLLMEEGERNGGIGFELRISSVLSASTNQALTKVLRENQVSKLKWARVRSDCCGVRVAYSKPDTLGVDRWLGFLAAYQAFQNAVMVVDAGSAVTIDVVDRTGAHQGGVIVPGLQRMAHGLLAGTDIPGKLLNGVQTGLYKGEPGTEVQDNTLSGICAGILGAVTGLVELHYRQALSNLAVPPQLVFTGGDAMKIQSGLPKELKRISMIDQNLVLDGLRLI